MGTKIGQRTTLRSGPWKGVRNTVDPFDDDPSLLYTARNIYIPDLQNGSGSYQRPGFALLNSGNAIYTSGSPFRASGGYSHVALDQTAYNFVVEGGHLFRVDQTLTVFTDVTPVGVTIDPGITTRVQFVSLAGVLVVNDRVNRPWIATNLSSTPITGTYIDFDGLGVSWSAQDITVYSGALVVLLKVLGGIAAQTDIAWSAPGDPATGYQQPTFDYRWTLEQTGSAPIFAIHGTNVGLYYWRGRSIGLATGAIGPDFQTSHTDDAIADNIGTETPQTIIGFTDRIFFTDQLGRPQMLPLGGTPQPIWLQMRTEVDNASTSYQATTAIVSTAAFEPTLNLYFVAIWSPQATAQAPCTEWFVFDAATGVYLGPWDIMSVDGGQTAVETLCTFGDNTGRAVLMAFGSKNTAPATGGYAWSMNALLGTPDILDTEGGSIITTEAGTRITTEGQDQVWFDNGLLPNINITTARLGYSGDFVWNIDQATVITGNSNPITVTVQTPTTAGTVEGSPAPSISQDGTFRCVVGCDAQGRGTQVVVTPSNTFGGVGNVQWSAQQVTLVAVASLAGPEDA